MVKISVLLYLLIIQFSLYIDEIVGFKHEYPSCAPIRLGEIIKRLQKIRRVECKIANK